MVVNIIESEPYNYKYEKGKMFSIGACTRIGPGLDCCASEICEKCDDPPERLLIKEEKEGK